MAKINAAFESLGSGRRKTRVGGIANPRQRLRGATVALLLFCAPLVLGGCAANARSYAGIPFAAGSADAGLQSLALRARAGDKHAQLELGIRFEEGRGVPVRRTLARRLYRLAARDSGGMVWTHSPSVRGVPGTPIQVDLGPRQAGLAEARRRLERLDRESGRPRGGGA